MLVWDLMPMMGIKRRHFIQLASLTLASTCVQAKTATANASNAPSAEWVLSAFDDEQHQHWISGFQNGSGNAFRIPVKHRSHGVTVNASQQQALFFSRRPGTEIHVVDLKSGELQQTINSAEGFHFYGHGILSADGRYLFTTENAYNKGHGVVAVYDAHNFQRLDSFHSGGIGPHQLAMLNDNNTLVVANGGILTHPSQPRKELNIPTMQSSLTYLEANSGKIIADYRPQHPQMSIRHLDVTNTNQVVMGVQFQGDETEILPLVLSHQGQDNLQPMHASELHWLGQYQYIASVALSSEHQLAATATPRGSNISLWNLQNNSLLKQIAMRDVAGVVYNPATKEFLFSNGIGEVASLNAENPQRLAPLLNDRAIRWDNHLALASL